jgi:hypothetical protein
MSDMKDTCDIGGWNDDGIDFPLGFFIGPEVAAFFPVMIPFLFHLVGIVRLIQ